MKIEITPELLADLKEKASKATAGPWVYDGHDVELDYEPQKKDRVHDWKNNHPRFVCDLNDGEYHEYTDEAEEKANGAYIAAANPAVMLALIARIEQLEKEIKCGNTHNFNSNDYLDNVKD